MRKSNDRIFLTFIFLSVIVLFAAAISGCTGEPPKGIRVNYSFVTYVVDENGSHDGYQVSIYHMNGVLSKADQHRSWSYSAGVTVNGTSGGEGYIWPVQEGDYMVFGASTDNDSLHSDWQNVSFSPGSAGNWTIFTPEDLTRHMVNNTTAVLNVTIYVSKETGKMIAGP